jgi:hypothetical protein
MMDHTGVRILLERVEVLEARKSLGIMVAGDGNWDSEYEYLLKILRDWRANLQAGHLSREDAWYALTHTINCTLEFPSMATFLSKQQCENIMKPFLNAGLSASGVVRSMPCDVVWDPIRYQGLGIKHLYTTQGIQKLLALLRHGTRPTLTGQLLRVTMEEIQLSTGLSRSFLSFPFAVYGLLSTRSWIKSTWQFLSASAIVVVIPFPRRPLQMRRTVS